ncbi:hypothetical protein E2C01_045414 [Portunus trituberculatus]|uniref:Uncharacterized protein n=1 Tax=Portunus trituberculatus TaxID=210409 RepID=A0A5B7G268_PORTR|nr:hypothetical protein [Portunus trituberculatus]
MAVFRCLHQGTEVVQDKAARESCNTRSRFIVPRILSYRLPASSLPFPSCSEREGCKGDDGAGAASVG